MKRKIVLLLALIALLPCLASCRRIAAHCFLCQGVPHSVPCVVNLSTGDVAELSPGGYGHIAFSTVGGVTVTSNNGEACTATLTALGKDMDPALFCNDCRELISQVPNSGYVLADIWDLTNISLYPIEVGASFPIGEYIVSIAEGDRGDVCIRTYRNDN